MKIYLITDTHFGHDKMVKYCGRPADFANKIIDGLEVIKEDDVLIHLGDFCIGNELSYHEFFMNNTKGKKWLIKGNHDHKSNSWYLDHGWDFVGEHMYDFYFGKKILFSHAPKKWDGYYDINIHGHFHNTLHRLLEGKYVVDGEKERNKEDLAVLTDKHKLLAIEYTDYKPVLLENFIKL